MTPAEGRRAYLLVIYIKLTALCWIEELGRDREMGFFLEASVGTGGKRKNIEEQRGIFFGCLVAG